MSDAYASQAIDFIRAAFPLFPDRDYCVVTVPTTAPEIPLLRGFVQVGQKPGKTASHCLYVINRFGLQDAVTVRLAQPSDLPDVENIVYGLPNEQEILASFKLSITKSPDTDGDNPPRNVPSPLPLLSPTHLTSLFTSPAYTSYLSHHTTQLVCLLILSPPTTTTSEPDTTTTLDLRAVTDQFDVEEFASVPKSKAERGKGRNRPVVVRHAVLNPLFENQGRWLFEETFRIAGITTLLYPVDERAARDPGTRRIAVKEFVPVKRRRRIQFPNDLRDGIPVPPPIQHNLQMLTTTMLYEPKIVVNTRIVVVGGSDVGISFLERLVYTPHLHFTNLTLISTEGAPSLDDEGESGAYVSRRCYTGLELKQIGLDSYVQIIPSSTTEFDRVLKRITLSNGAFVAYDYLSLTPGTQFDAATLGEDFAGLDGVFALNRGEREK
ncbi:hypothetical protein HK104_006968, partial [Borealophlyctis nickersoniae]